MNSTPNLVDISLMTKTSSCDSVDILPGLSMGMMDRFTNFSANWLVRNPEAIKLICQNVLSVEH